MKKIIIDPGLFEFTSGSSRFEEIEHFNYLKSCIDFTCDNLDVALDQFDGAPFFGLFCNSSSYTIPPITKSRYMKINFNQIIKKLQKMIKKGELVDLENKKYDVECPIEFEIGSVAELPFKYYLGYIYEKTLCNKMTDAIILLSFKNRKRGPIIKNIINKIEARFIAIEDPSIDCNGIVKDFLYESTAKHSIFSQKKSCSKLNDTFLKDKEISKNLKELYKKYGTEVALRNGYVKRDDITRKNPNYTVFVNLIGSHYLSIDLEHGGLELFRNDGSGTLHQGEYDFACNLVKKADPQTHKLVK